MSEHELASMRDQIEAERKRLREEKDMAEEERNKAESALRKQESALTTAQSDHDAMKQKLAALEKKIIVGGENLLDKVLSHAKVNHFLYLFMPSAKLPYAHSWLEFLVGNLVVYIPW